MLNDCLISLYYKFTQQNPATSLSFKLFCRSRSNYILTTALSVTVHICVQSWKTTGWSIVNMVKYDLHNISSLPMGFFLRNQPRPSMKSQWSILKAFIAGWASFVVKWLNWCMSLVCAALVINFCFCFFSVFYWLSQSFYFLNGWQKSVTLYKYINTSQSRFRLKTFC